ncbi:MAG: hypothetical protein EOM23_11980, partial [Candidatus Moranbacteria bacterium]|nr:hypothetical protein [Candidatus Moranbacteria bacterium]
EHIYIYLKTDTWDKDILTIRQQFDLKELVQGGNVHFIKPFYQESIFTDQQIIDGFAVVSNLQLFLDLYHFQSRGREHAEFLKEQLEQKGQNLGQ